MQLIQITDKTGKKLEEKTLDLAVVREKLAQSKGQAYWRSLEELAEEPGFDELLHREFPGQAPKDWAPLARRDFVKLMGAALALAGLSGCAFQPQEKIVPYVDAPEENVPGIPLFYATAYPFMGYGLGVLAEAHEGRPTKLEGNPDHPISGGAADVWTQASILDLYDPDRSQVIRSSGASSSWDELSGTLAKAVAASKVSGGSDFALLTGTITSPTLLAEIAELQTRLPNMQWVSYEEINSDNRREGARIAFGKDVHTLHHFDRASVIVSLDSDFLLEEPGRVAHGREFIAGRTLNDAKGDVKAASAATMNRLYVIESTPTITGSNADHRFPVKASEVDGIARALAGAVGVPNVTGETPKVAAKWLQAIADDLRANRGKVLVVAGAHQPASVHAVAHAINAHLKSTGDAAPTSYYDPIEKNTKSHREGLKALVDSMNKGQIKTLIVMGTNPAYSAPADLKFADALKKVKLTVHSGTHEDETSSLCLWHVPEAHFLEYWGDVRAIDGTVSLIQPLIQPLYDAAKAPSQILAALLSEPEGVLVPKYTPTSTPYELTRTYWQGQPISKSARKAGEAESLGFDRFWSTAVHKGIVDGERIASVTVALSPSLNLGTAVTPITGLEVNFRPDGTMWDGRFANNPWLQECPKPYSRIVWDNAVFVSPDTAFENNWRNNQEVTVSVNGQSITGAIFMLPGQPNNTITLHLGYGRKYSGKICTADDGGVRGFNASDIRSVNSPWWTGGATVTPTGRVYKIATTSNHNLIAPGGKDTTLKDSLLKSDNSKTHLIDNIIEPEDADLDIDGTHRRDLVRTGTFDDFKAGKLPTRPTDKRGIPITWPKNLDEFREHELEPVSEGHGESKVDDKGRPRWQENRELEGNPSFYPRDSDYLAQTPFRDASVNQEEAAKAEKAGRNGLTQQWGMSVDLNSCIGCNACVVACQSENNSATVGKDQILMGRELHWIRIDTYYRGSFENPEVYFEPMMCQHCEKAPCAPVCPFNATMITPDGINEQVYNRCVGTKYCENNCPYKVRRFNFLQYSDQQSPVIQLMSNPDVTVRSRGVMEKCTYCIQRVNGAKWQAEKEGRYVRDGEIQTACAQTCPTNAIVFGDINDPTSQVSRRKRGALTFGILTELNTMPRTTYMAKFRNPNPALVKLGEEFAAETLQGEVEHEGEEGEGAHGAAGAHAESGAHTE